MGIVKKVPVTGHVYEIFLGDKIHRLSENDANNLHNDLAEALGKPTLNYKGCGDRMSHGPHMWGTAGNQFLCRGLSYDQT